MVTILIENWFPDLENMTCRTKQITLLLFWKDVRISLTKKDTKPNLIFMTNGNV